MSFSHLHLHTDASPDGLGTVSDLIKHVKSIGQESCAITDHGTLTNAVSFYRTCIDNQIKPIIGVESYIEVEGKRGHITLLADGDLGWSNLVALQNLAHRQTEETRATFTPEQLFKHSEGIICLSGCVSSPFHYLPYADARELGLRFKNAFGERFFAEIMVVSESPDIHERALRLASDLKLTSVLTNDAHFQRQEHAGLQAMLVKMRGYEYDGNQLWTKSEQELVARCKKLGLKFETYIDNAGWLAGLIDAPNLKHAPTTPHVADADNKLRDLCRKNIATLFGAHWTAEYETRLGFELDTIKERNASAYFVILRDILTNSANGVHDKFIARGSGCGSLALYMLGLTQTDPILYDLSFERFLNPLRKGLPDVDMDFSPSTRTKVIQHAKDNYGGVPVAAYGLFHQASLIRALAKETNLSLEATADIAEKGTSSKNWAASVKAHPIIAEAFIVMEGQINTRSKHAAGVILEADGLIVPIERSKDGSLVSAWGESSSGKDDISYIGAVKYDFLSIDGLTAIEALESEYKYSAPKPENTSDLDKEAIFELFAGGKTEGIFQFSGSQGITEFTKLMLNSSGYYPDFFNELVLCNASYRPAAMAAVKEFPNYKKTPIKHDALLADLLRPTFGVIVYQEQMMGVYAKVVGGGLAEADLARRIIAKAKVDDPNWQKEMLAMQQAFSDGGKSLSWTNEYTNSLWEQLLAATGYGFNLSHATAYTFISWQLAWWKIKHPVAFFTAVLNTDEDKQFEYSIAAVRFGIELKMPHVNVSGFSFKHDDNTIYYPFSVLRGIGDNSSRAIVENREQNGVYMSVEDFRKRLEQRKVNSGHIVALIETGAFDGLFDKEDEPSCTALISNKDMRLKDRTIDVQLSDVERQRKYLDFVMPNPALLKSLDKQRGKFEGGIITGVVKKKTQKGRDIIRYMCIPGKSFYTFSDKFSTEFEIGEIVFVTLQTWGEMKQFKKGTYQ